jgi:hypothetical protein
LADGRALRICADADALSAALATRVAALAAAAVAERGAFCLSIGYSLDPLSLGLAREEQR